MITPKQLFSFYKLAEKLKTTVRHSWLSDKNRQESVAEHSWMMALLALVTLPHIQKPLNQEKILKMILIHDLAEAITKDMPVWKGSVNKKKKYLEEKRAIDKISKTLDSASAIELRALWEEYELRESLESKFVKAIDTLDVIAQHNIASLETWDDNDYLWQISKIQDNFFDFDETLRKVKNELDSWSIEKVRRVGKLDKLDQIELKKKLSKKK